jgi:hypothetical protein
MHEADRFDLSTDFLTRLPAITDPLEHFSAPTPKVRTLRMRLVHLRGRWQDGAAFGSNAIPISFLHDRSHRH